jgi:hypothetical protein
MMRKACQVRSFAQRRDAAVIAVLTATGVRAAELARICSHPDNPRCSDAPRRAITGSCGSARQAVASPC